MKIVPPDIQSNDSNHHPVSGSDHHAGHPTTRTKHGEKPDDFVHTPAHKPPADTVEAVHLDPSNHDHHHDHSEHIEDFKQRFIISLSLMIPILALSPMIQHWLNVNWRFTGDKYLLFALSTILFLYGGRPFLTGALQEFRSRRPSMMALISLGISVAYLYSSATVFLIEGMDFFWEMATLIVIMLLGHWLEGRSVGAASRSLEELANLLPDKAHVLDEQGNISERAVADLKTGDRIMLRPGEKVPIDGIIEEGRSEVDESMISGESVPVIKEPGDEIIGGALNGDGSLTYRVTHVGDDTFLSQVIRLVQEAQASQSRTQRLADKAAGWWFYIALLSGFITFITWLLIRGDLGFAVERTVTVMIIACPHALGLATPLVTAVSTALGAKNGLLIRDRAAFERGRKTDLVIFDKTGTLTEGQFGIDEIIALATITEDEILALTYSLEAPSEHPIAKGIVRQAERQNIPRRKVEGFENLPGSGIRGSIDGHMYQVVSPGYLERNDISFDDAKLQRRSRLGQTVVFLLEETEVLGALALSDTVRENAKQAVRDLLVMGIEPVMLTGDNQEVAKHVAQQLGITTVIAEVLPQDKANIVKQFQSRGRFVTMTGDGVNDAPALATSDLGIAIGAGTDVAMETADVILVKSDPSDVPTLIKLSRATYRKMIQNLIWATAYNIIALPLAAGVLYPQGITVSPAIGAILMSASTIIVALNAKLLKIER